MKDEMVRVTRTATQFISPRIAMRELTEAEQTGLNSRKERCKDDQ